MKKPLLKILILALFCCFIAFVYFFPRYLTNYLGENHFLSSYLYIYTLGILFFSLNIFLLLRSKALYLKREGEKKWLFLFIIGLICAMTMHGTWIATAVLFPFKGIL